MHRIDNNLKVHSGDKTDPLAADLPGEGEPGGGQAGVCLSFPLREPSKADKVQHPRPAPDDI